LLKNYSFITEYFPYYMDGLKYTLYVSLLSVLIGMMLGILFAMMKLSKNKVLQVISSCYINFIRGTPMLIQVYIVYYVLCVNLPNLVSAVIALSINSGAYSAEIIRAGIQSVDKGQMEAARSLGMSRIKAMIYIILPQAIKNILPAMCNEFIGDIKATSLMSVIAVHELMYNANIVRSLIYRAFEPLIVAAVLYFTITYILKLMVGLLERRLQASD